MEEAYLLILFALIWLAITDLVVGVSNDAINFLHSAVGSRAFPLKKILIVASIGIACGVLFSSGLMEVARKGIFIPSAFSFEEIMVIFLAVMITDVILLDFFNSLGLPTSTTVAIVFELLGAAVVVAVFKELSATGSVGGVLDYINTSKSVEIIFGILLSIVLAFILGAIVQYISRLVLTFHFDQNLKYFGAIFGGGSLTALFYFLLLKGVQTIDFFPADIRELLFKDSWLVLLVGFVVLSLLSYALIKWLKVHILKLVIVVGTFALALAFAANDLVNFIGVPVAAWQSFGLWREAYLVSGVTPSEFPMNGLEGEVATPYLLLVSAGVVMILTLWFSKRAQAVVQTGVNLSRQGYGRERFSPNYLSRSIVKQTVFLADVLRSIMPEKFSKTVGSRFVPKKEVVKGLKSAPAFDMVRACVNLVVASILISIGTSYQLPLSTTYVTFMVAMGTSFADGAWDRENAVYRVSGVLSVIVGWLVTAVVAFGVAAVFAGLIYVGGMLAVAILMGLAVVVITRGAILYSRKLREEKAMKTVDTSDLVGIREVVLQTSDNVAGVIGQVGLLYSQTIDNLGYQDQKSLKKTRRTIKKLEADIDDLKSNVFYVIRSLGEDSVGTTIFYVRNLDFLQDMVQSMRFITRSSYRHVNNNHKNLKFSHIKNLKQVEDQLKQQFSQLEDILRTQEYSRIEEAMTDLEALHQSVSKLIMVQLERIRTSETSPKNAMLYFSLLLETRNLVKSCSGLLELFRDFYSEVNRV